MLLGSTVAPVTSFTQNTRAILANQVEAQNKFHFPSKAIRKALATDCSLASDYIACVHMQTHTYLCTLHKQMDFVYLSSLHVCLQSMVEQYEGRGHFFIPASPALTQILVTGRHLMSNKMI